MKNLDRILADYDYSFPTSLIAQKPAHPRDRARLVVYERRSKKVLYSTFKQLADFLPSRALLVFNETKVIPARIPVIKETGGRVELLYVEITRGFIKALANRKLTTGAVVRLAATRAASPYRFTVVKTDGRFYYLKPSFSLAQLNTILLRYGKTPLPYYIKNPNSREAVIRKQYQTFFAKNAGSIAAPTASLHFTKGLLAQLRRSGFDTAFVTLHVGMGTFAPVTSEHIARKKLHTETFSIDRRVAERLNQAKQEGRPIIAVGTTVMRTLESATNARGRIVKLHGETALFIRPPYHFKVADGLITNFHVPRSSLLMLVSAFCGRKETLSLYRKAITKKFKLFSFGDGMLLY